MTRRDPEGCKIYAAHRLLQATKRYYLARSREDQERAAKWVLAWAMREKALPAANRSRA